jgi:hypothetical protein
MSYGFLSLGLHRQNEKETLVWSRPFLVAKFHQKEIFRIQKSSDFGRL